MTRDKISMPIPRPISVHQGYTETNFKYFHTILLLFIFTLDIIQCEFISVSLSLNNNRTTSKLIYKTNFRLCITSC